MHLQKFSGNTVLEYLLIGGLIGIVMIASLLFLGGNLGGVFTGLKAEMLSEGSGIGTIGGSGGGNGGENQNLTITTSNGEQITVPAVPTNLSLMIETVGANGTTEMLATNIQQFSFALLDAGEIDEAQANLLLDLANRGHQNANHQKLTLDLLLKGGVEDYPDYTLDVNLSDYEFTGMFLNDEYKKVQESGVLDNPAIGMLVDYLVDSIRATDAAVWQEGEAFLNGQKTAEEATADIANSDELTHRDSADICTTGGGTDSGIQCGD